MPASKKTQNYWQRKRIWRKNTLTVMKFSCTEPQRSILEFWWLTNFSFSSSAFYQFLRFYQDLLSVYWDNLMISVFDYIYMVNYIYRFTHIKPFLHLWNGTNLVIINDNLDGILNMICMYFIEDFFCIYVHQGELSAIFFFFFSFVLVSQ